MCSYQLSGQFTVNLPPAKAFRLFTARGEMDWVDGWQPRFPVSTEDDTVPGTVFETDAHGHRTTWIVVESRPPHRIRYAQVRHGERAGTVTVTLEERDGATEVTVTYHLTPLTDAAGPELEHFAAGYPAFLAGWPEAIATRMDGRL
ncbi:MAG: SRPBCC family protein [Stackebrandtia sp.]